MAKTKAPAKKAAEKKPKVNDWEKPSYWLEYDRVTVMTEREKLRELDKLEKRFEDAVEQAKALRAQFAAANTDLKNYTRERMQGYGKKPQETLTTPIERKEDAKKAQDNAKQAADIVKGVAESMGMDKPEYDEKGVHKDAWSHFPLDRFTAFADKPKVIEKIVKAMLSPQIKGESGSVKPVKTMGDLQAFISPGNGWTRKLADVKGIGPEAANKWAALELVFWDKWTNGGLAEEFAKEKMAEVAGIYRDPESKEGKAAAKKSAAKPAPKKSGPALRGGGAKPEAKAKAKAGGKKSPAKANKDEPAGDGASIGTEQDWNDEGGRAFREGKSLAENPYADGQKSHTAWNEGYEDGRLEAEIRGEGHAGETADELLGANSAA